jgi:transposase
MRNKTIKNCNYELRRTRTFSEEFKRKKVQEITSRLTRIGEVCKEYQVTAAAVYKWIYRYSSMKKKERLIVESESDTKKIEALRMKIADLERTLGQKQIQIEFLSKMIDIAEESYQVDIKKKFGGKP